MTIIAIMDMPLFIIAVVYGLLWKRANWQGAIGGYIAGSVAGGIGQFYFGLDFNITTFITAGVTLVVTPAVTLLTKHPDEMKVETIWMAKISSREEDEQKEIYHIIPTSLSGRLGLGLYAGGTIIFLTGVFLGSADAPAAGFIAVGGMIVYFLGGLWRAYSS